MNKKLCTMLVFSILVSGCSYLPEMPEIKWSSLNPWSENVEPEKKVEEKKPLGVNHYLWQASLNKLSFMPMASVDSSTGVMVTEWSAMDGASSEQFKIVVRVLSKNLRADALKAEVFKRELRNGKWVDVQPDKKVAVEIESAILVEARKLFRRDYVAGEE